MSDVKVDVTISATPQAAEVKVSLEATVQNYGRATPVVGSIEKAIKEGRMTAIALVKELRSS